MSDRQRVLAALARVKRCAEGVSGALPVHVAVLEKEIGEQPIQHKSWYIPLVVSHVAFAHIYVDAESHKVTAVLLAAGSWMVHCTIGAMTRSCK